MTVQPTRDQLLDMTEDLRVLGDRPDLCDEVVDGLWAALDQAEARIKDVRDALDEAEARIDHHPAYTHSGQRMDPIVYGGDVRRALDGDGQEKM